MYKEVEREVERIKEKNNISFSLEEKLKEIPLEELVYLKLYVNLVEPRLLDFYTGGKLGKILLDQLKSYVVKFFIDLNRGSMKAASEMMGLNRKTVKKYYTQVREK